MANESKPDPLQILRSAKNILLVDWPDPGVPRALLNAGFNVFGYSPGGYSSVTLLPDAYVEGGVGSLVFQKMAYAPGAVDIVNIYRPNEEHAGIVDKQVKPLKAKVVWLHPPFTSAGTAKLAHENGLIFIEGISIAETVTRI
jgi:predicted CoA-binding protein